MNRIALAFGVLLVAWSSQAAQPEFEPTAEERKAVADCLERVAGEPELKQMSECIGIVAGPCPDASGANTFTIVACHMREQKIWDGYLNEWYGEAVKRLAGDPGAAAALKESERAWIVFRDEKCGYWEKRYEGGTFASAIAGDCMRVETGRRAFEMRAIFDDLDH
ncbi:MAG: lysozyme inhibitor LprI family protein [Methyloceanibacter sp.]